MLGLERDDAKVERWPVIGAASDRRPSAYNKWSCPFEGFRELLVVARRIGHHLVLFAVVNDQLTADVLKDGGVRDSIVVYVGNEIYGVKWQNWKMMLKELATGTGPVEQWSIPRFFNLNLDPKEAHALSYRAQYAWVVQPAGKVL